MPKPSSPSPKSAFVYVPRRIVSGGQTGVDRAGLEAAIAKGLAHGGWCPKRRLSEDGSIPSRYELVEMDSAEYPPRTQQNVIDSDATLILYEQRLKGGTLLTRRYAKQWNKPFVCIRIDRDTPESLHVWLQQTRPDVLNVAGPRESSFPGIQQRATEFLLHAFAPPKIEHQAIEKQGLGESP